MIRRVRNRIINRCIVPFIERHRWLEPYWICLCMVLSAAWHWMTLPLYWRAWRRLRGVDIPEGCEVWVSKSGLVFLIPDCGYCDSSRLEICDEK